jgi:Peptidase C13 family
MRGTALTLALVLACAASARAQDTHVLIVTGVGGDEEHTAQFHKWAAAMVDVAKQRGGVPDANVTFLSEKPDLDAAKIKARSTRENVQKALADIAMRAQAADEVFIMLIGHGSFDGKTAAFNLPGPDLTVDEYAMLLSKIVAQRVIFINTASSSGAFLQALAGPGRTIVTATKTGGERNEPRFPQYFVEAFQNNAADTDRNGRVSIAEAFEYAKNKVTDAYQKEGHILTEHAALDDGREGKFAATLFLESEKARASQTASIADPVLRGLVEEQRKLENDIAALRLRKDSMDPAQYEQQLEKLATELAIKTRAVREREGKK